MKNYFKKSLSVFMAALMLLSCWVFFAPEKAEAVTQGQYYYRFTVYLTDNWSNAQENSQVRIFYKTANGKGSETTAKITYNPDEGWWNKDEDKTYTVCEGTVPGFPYKVEQYGKTSWLRTMEYKDAKLYVGSSLSNLTEVASGGTFKVGSSGNVTSTVLTVDSSKYPKANSVVFDQSPSPVTVPTSGNATTTFQTHVNDQYGVRIASTASTYSKSVKLSSNVSSTTGISAAYGTTTNTYDPGTVTVTNSAKLQNYDTNTITLTASYTFNGVTKTASKSFVVTDPKYTFSFNANGGSISPSAAVSKYYYNTLAANQIPVGTRDGYEFLGMYTTAYTNYDATKPSYSGALTTSTKIDMNRTWYAGWWAKNVDVTFVDNGGNVVHTASAKYDKPYSYAYSTLPEAEYDRQGSTGTYTYVFDHWEVEEAYDANGNKVSGAYGTRLEDYALKGKTTFKAVYSATKNSYNVKFYGENGNQLRSDDYAYRALPTQPSVSKNADNYFTYKFIGWHKVASGETKKGYVVNSDGYLSTSATSDAADAGNKYISVSSDLTVRGDAEYVPVFEKTFIDYTVNFQYYNATGTLITTEAKTYHYNDALDLPTVPASYTSGAYRYPLTGWNTANGALPTVAAESKTYVAKYGDAIPAEYTITFSYFNADGTAAETTLENVKHNTAVNAPVPASTYRDDDNEYTFVKWVDQDGEDFSATAYKDADYTAQYSADPLYTATFYNGSEQFDEVFKYTAGSKIIAPANDPTKAADSIASLYTFDGWYDEDGNALSTMGSENAVFYAKYTPTYHEYPITFVWKNADGTDKTDTKKYHYGDEIIVPVETPEQYKDNTYTYTFKAWDIDVPKYNTGSLDEDGKPVAVTYTATYRKEYNYYGVTWMKETDAIVDGQIQYEKYQSDFFIYNERVRIPAAAPESTQKPESSDYSMVLDHWQYKDASGNWIKLNHGDRITANMIFYPVYRQEARVCKVTLLDEDEALIGIVRVPYGEKLVDSDAYGVPTKSYTDTIHFVFDAWLDAEGNKAADTITDDVTLTASYKSEEHKYSDVVATRNPTFTELGAGEAFCSCGKAIETTIAKIPDTVSPTAQLYVKDVITKSSEEVDAEKEVLVAPNSNLIIVTHDTAEVSDYNASGTGIGVKTIEYVVSFGDPIEDLTAVTDWTTRFDYDAYVEKLLTENAASGFVGLTPEQEAMLKDFESNTSAYVEDLKVNAKYADKLVDGAEFYFYTKITDKNGNSCYVSSNKLIYDAVSPIILLEGGGNGGSKFCTSVTATAFDTGLVSFTVNGEEKFIGSADIGRGSMITLNTKGDYQLVAKDEAGNVTTKNITIIGEHREKIYQTPATCEEPGQIVKKCTVCGEQIGEASVITATGHKYVKGNTVEPTCIDDGYTLYRCEYCALTKKDDVVKATGSHTYETENDGWKTITEPTCSETGLAQRTCTVCGDVSTKTLDKVADAHRWYRGVVTKPTCVDGGYTTHTCKYCGKTETYDLTDALGHEAGGEWVVTEEATCTEDGTKVRYCVRCSTDCGDPLETATITAAGHYWTFEKIVEPTEDAEGYTLYVCQVCREERKDNYVAKLEPRVITFISEGEEFKKFENKYAGDAIIASAVGEPTKEADNTYRYTFSHWADENGQKVILPLIVTDKDVTLTAVFESRAINYTVTFYNEADANGDFRLFKKVGYLKYNDTVTSNGPADYEDDYFTYAFAGWKLKDDIGAEVVTEIVVKGDADYVAVFNKTAKIFNVTFAYDYNNVITTFKVTAGEDAAYPEDLALPTKSADADYHYTFIGWKGDKLTDITANTLLLAKFDAQPHDHDGGSTVISNANCTEGGKIEYKCSCGYVTTVNTPANGHSWSTTVNEKGEYVCSACGETKDSGIRYTVTFYTEGANAGEFNVVKRIGFLKVNDVLADSQIPTPTKAGDSKYDYNFIGWYKKGDATKTQVEITKTITADAEYVAIFEATEKTYRIIYRLDGSTTALQVITDVKGGEKLSDHPYTGATPTSDKFDDYGHQVFYGWDKEDTDLPNGIESDVVVTAVFISKSHTTKTHEMKGATCTEPMKETFKCTECGYTYEKSQGKALGHDYKLVETVDPTETKDGYELYKCQRAGCGHEYKKTLPMKTYIFFTVTVKDQHGSPVEGATVSLFDGTTFVASGTTDANGQITFRVDAAKTYRVVVEGNKFDHTEADITVNPDGSTNSNGISVEVDHCSCTCHRDGVWPSIFRFFHKIICMLTGHFVCCGDPDPRYNS